MYGVFDDGALLAAFPTSIAPPSPGSVLTDTINLWRFDHGSDERRLITRLPGPIWMWTGRYQLPVPLTMNPLRAVNGQRLVTASGAFPEIQIHESTGGLVERYRLPHEPVAMARDEVRTMVDDWIDRGIYMGPATVWDEWFDRMPVPQQRPAFDRLLLDDAGNIWVRRFDTALDSTVSPSWDVVAPDGRYRGVTMTPRGLEVMAVRASSMSGPGRGVNGSSILAGVSRDSLDVEYVSVHRIGTRAPIRTSAEHASAAVRLPDSAGIAAPRDAASPARTRTQGEAGRAHSRRGRRGKPRSADPAPCPPAQ